MQRIDLNALAQFAVVARHLNFRRAAAELAMSPSTLSERIRELEASLGTRLFNRTTRSCALTPEGSALLGRSRGALAILEEATTALGDEDALTGTIRINGPRPALELQVMRHVTSFAALHHDVRFVIRSQGDLVDIVAAGYDAGVRYDDMLDQDMIAVRLGPDQRMVIAAGTDYLERRGRPAEPDDLNAHDCIGTIFSGGNILPWSLEKGGSRKEYVPDARILINDVDSALYAGRAGLGLLYTFENYLEKDLAAGTMEIVMGDWTPPFAGPSLYYPERRLMPKTLRAFIDHVKANKDLA